MNWEDTEQELKRLNDILISLHQRPERDWEIHEKNCAQIVRRKLRDLGEYRYSLLRKKNEPTN
jgi:hypothetical protein